MTDTPFTETHRATLCELATGWMSGRFPDAIDAALAEIDRLHAMRAEVERLPRYAVHGDGTMIEWPHGEFISRDEVLALLLNAYPARIMPALGTQEEQ